MSAYRASVNAWLVEVTDDCIASGQCVITAPDLFEIGPDDRSRFVLDTVPASRLVDVERAASGCPMEAIRIVPASS